MWQVTQLLSFWAVMDVEKISKRAEIISTRDKRMDFFFTAVIP